MISDEVRALTSDTALQHLEAIGVLQGREKFKHMTGQPSQSIMEFATICHSLAEIIVRSPTRELAIIINVTPDCHVHILRESKEIP